MNECRLTNEPTSPENIYVPGGRSAADGFTLVEVLVALSIVAIALVTLLHLQLVSIRMTDRAAQMSRAALLADSKMAETVARGHPGIGSESGTVEDAGGGVVLHWQTSVSEMRLGELEDAGVTGLRSVYVKVTWNEGERQEQVHMATYVADMR